MPMPNLLAMSQEILLALDFRLLHFPELRTLTNGIEQRVFLHRRIGTVVPWDGLR